MQSKRMSLLEAFINIGIGYFVALGMWSYVVGPLFNVDTNAGQDIGIVTSFMFVSMLRQYLIRRFFATRIHRLAAWIANVPNR